MKTETEERLKQFIERAKLLGESSYLTSVRKTKINLLPPSFEGPDREELDAFANRLRFFVQNNEPTSLANISELLKSDSSVPQQLVSDFEDMRADLKKAFDSLPPIQVTTAKYPDPPTWDTVWNTFIYGEVVHTSKKHTPRYEDWLEHEPTFALMSYYLSRILPTMASGITYAARLFEKELPG